MKLTIFVFSGVLVRFYSFKFSFLWIFDFYSDNKDFVYWRSLHKTYWGATKNCENKNLSFSLRPGSGGTG